MMLCSDCKIPMEEINFYSIDGAGNTCEIEAPYWRCPKCRVESDVDAREDL